MNTFEIRPLTNEDSPAIVSLILPIQQIEFNVPVTIDAQPDLLDIEKFYFGTGGHFWGAYNDKELVGTIALIDAGQDTGAIRKMFVKKEFRGKEYGLAQRLLDVLIDYSRKRGIAQLYLGTVDQLKAAQRFYVRNGFSQIPADNLPSHFPRMKVDTMFYHREIKQL